MSLATPQDVAARLGRALTSDEETLAQTLLDDVEAMIRAAALRAGKTFDDLDPDIVKRVEANAVARVLRNPEGYRSEQDGDYGYQIDTRVAAGFLFLTADEWSDLGLGGKAFTVNTRPPAPADDGYLYPDTWFQYGWPVNDPPIGWTP